MEPGEHTVSAQARGYTRSTRQVSCASGAVCEVNFQLTLAPRKLRVESVPPGADVHVNGALSGKTPCEVDVETGRQTIALKLIGFEAAESIVNVPSALSQPVPALTVKLKAEPTPLRVQINSDPAGAAVLEGSTELGKTPLAVDLSPGRHELKLQLEGFDSAPLTVTIGAQGPAPTVPMVRLKSRPQVLSIKTTPPGAVLFVDGKNVGRSPWKGSVAAGSREVRAEKTGFVSLTDLVAAPGEVDLTLVPVPTGFKLVLEPSAAGAEVKVDGVPTVLEGDLYQARPGVHSVEVLAPGFKLAKGTVKVGATQVPTLSLKLSAAPVVAKQGLLIITTPPGARVSINEVFSGLSPHEASLAPGEYRLLIEAQGHRPLNLAAEVKRGEQSERRLVLTPSTKSVAVESTPPGAKVFIDGEAKGVTPLMLTLDVAPHRVYLTLEGYQPLDEMRNVELAAPATWSFQLQPTAVAIAEPPPPPPPLVPVSAAPVEAVNLENALRLIAEVKGDPEVKRKLMISISSSREDLTELVNAATPEPLRDELCVKYAAKVRPVRYSAKAVDSFGADTKAKLVVNGVDYAAVPFEGSVPWCTRSIQARDATGQIVTRKDDKALDARLINSDVFEFEGRRRRWTFSVFGEGGGAPFLSFLEEGQPYRQVDLQPVFWGAGGRIDFWGETFHLSLAGKATSLFRSSLLNDRTATVSPAADFFIGLGAAAGSDAVRYRFAFDVGAWTLVCPTMRLVNAVSFNEIFYINLTLDARYIPAFMAPTLGPNDLGGPPLNFMTLGASLAIGVGH